MYGRRKQEWLVKNETELLKRVATSTILLRNVNLSTRIRIT